MKTLLRCCHSVTGIFLAASFGLLQAEAGSLTLDFSSAGGTVLDAGGVGTGFSARLAGTGANITGNDPNLTLNTGSGVLELRTSPGADFNGQMAMADASVVGVHLSEVGFTGAEDFVAKATFVNLTNLHQHPDQLCLVVGTSSTDLIRAGFINFDQYHGGPDANEAFAVNTSAGGDSSVRFFGELVGGTMSVEIRRASGRWFVLVNGVDRLPNSDTDGRGTPAPPGFLDDAADLFVGVVAMDVDNNSPWSAGLDEFSVSVTPITAPSVVAHWRFEQGPAFANVPHAGADGAFDGSTPDLSGNGNDLSVWTEGSYAGFAYRSDVPFGSVPQNGEGNVFSIKNTGGNPAMFTKASASLPTGINADTMTPTQFTVEASYKPESGGAHRTMVGRDARNVSTSNGNLAALYLQIRPDDSIGIAFTDVSGYTHSAFSPPAWTYGFEWASDPEGTNPNAGWYNVAAVSDGDTLKVHVNGLLVAWTDLTVSGSPNRALAVGTTSESGYTAGAWTVGRGLYAGGHTDRAYGFIDEVRLCNSALTPDQFLASHKSTISVSAPPGASLTVNVAGGEPGRACYVLQSTNLSATPVQWTPVASGVFNASGHFTGSIPKPTGPGSTFVYLRAEAQQPVSGPLSYRLAQGHKNWPANIRAEIMYAMDGAVAVCNRYAQFPRKLLVTYNPGVPTAQAGYGGQIDFGGSRSYRVALHEISHTLGVGTAPGFCGMTSGGVWTGANATALVKQFDGSGAVINTDCTHIWPYGLNYDDESSDENDRRHVLIVDAIRKDLGL